MNQHVKSAMVQWIGGVVKDKFEKLVNETGDETGEDTEEIFCIDDWHKSGTERRPAQVWHCAFRILSSNI